MSAFMVKGHAFVPVAVNIPVEADNADEAIKRGNKFLKTKIRDFIVSGSEDDGAAFGFDATCADPLTAEEVEKLHSNHRFNGDTMLRPPVKTEKLKLRTPMDYSR